MIMGIDMTQIYYQVKIIRELSTELRDARSAFTSYQHSLNAHWKGVEMPPTNLVVEEHRNRLAAIAADLDDIGSDIIREAEAIKRAEELAAAQAALAAAE